MPLAEGMPKNSAQLIECLIALLNFLNSDLIANLDKLGNMAVARAIPKTPSGNSIIRSE